MIFDWFTKRNRRNGAASKSGVPTVKFDASRVSDTVRADLWESVRSLPDIPEGHQEALYAEALRSIEAGRALNILCDALILMDMPKSSAAAIARFLNNRATSAMNAERALASGITEAKWMYSGAPCFSTVQPTDGERRRDEAHKAANGKRYRLADGMAIDGVTTHPGRDGGCKCVSIPIVPGFGD